MILYVAVAIYVQLKYVQNINQLFTWVIKVIIIALNYLFSYIARFR